MTPKTKYNYLSALKQYIPVHVQIANEYGNADPGDTAAVDQFYNQTLTTLPPQALEVIWNRLLNATEGNNDEHHEMALRLASKAYYANGPYVPLPRLEDARDLDEYMASIRRRLNNQDGRD